MTEAPPDGTRDFGGAGGDGDDGNAGAGGMDLSPRPARPARRGIRRWAPVAVAAVVALAIGLILWRVLADATLVFREVDDAVERREELGDDRFRMIGSPVSGSVQEVSLDDGRPAVAFSVTLDGVVADVVHTGGVSDQFQPEVPVVIDGRWVRIGDNGAVSNESWAASDGWYFASDRMLVKHDNDYRVDNQDRIDDAELRGQYE